MEGGQLKALGFRGGELSVYRALLGLRTGDAKAISEKSGIPPTAVYPILRSLVKKGLAQEISGDPRKYQAIPPETGMKSYAEARADEVRRLGISIVPEFQMLFSKSGATGTRLPEPVTLSLGFVSSRNLNEELVRRSKKTLYILGWSFHPSKNKNFYRMLRQLGALVEAGVDVRMLLRKIEKGAEKFARDYSEKGIQIREHPIENFSLVVSDSSECKITLKNPLLGERMNLYVKDKDLSSALETYFLSLWKKAKQAPDNC
ncbi:MAG: helix-turn-helix domain-containing protein [archaeon]